ncbi:Hypothetical predicted protein [Olea europaea subsp. europaea]|uniref:Prolamin-like domain-containing protein n=1 Tax=Olea europaea subsp. europaea TaxID=158383 RepID=A0A8S0VNK4_OLEEU|nr:Hypothetical predicted protein [Olea europaea subsp. europaea]
MATSAMPRSIHVATAPNSQFSTVGALRDAVLMMEDFSPCLEALQYIKAGCKEEIFAALFGLPLDNACCKLVKQIAKICLPEGFPLIHAFLPVALENYIITSTPPTGI